MRQEVPKPNMLGKQKRRSPTPSNVAVAIDGMLEPDSRFLELLRIPEEKLDPVREFLSTPPTAVSPSQGSLVVRDSPKELVSYLSQQSPKLFHPSFFDNDRSRAAVLRGLTFLFIEQRFGLVRAFQTETSIRFQLSLPSDGKIYFDNLLKIKTILRGQLVSWALAEWEKSTITSINISKQGPLVQLPLTQDQMTNFRCFIEHGSKTSTTADDCTWECVIDHYCASGYSLCHFRDIGCLGFQYSDVPNQTSVVCDYRSESCVTLDEAVSRLNVPLLLSQNVSDDLSSLIGLTRADHMMEGIKKSLQDFVLRRHINPGFVPEQEHYEYIALYLIEMDASFQSLYQDGVYCFPGFNRQFENPLEIARFVISMLETYFHVADIELREQNLESSYGVCRACETATASSESTLSSICVPENHCQGLFHPGSKLDDDAKRDRMCYFLDTRSGKSLDFNQAFELASERFEQVPNFPGPLCSPCKASETTGTKCLGSECVFDLYECDSHEQVFDSQGGVVAPRGFRDLALSKHGATHESKYKAFYKACFLLGRLRPRNLDPNAQPFVERISLRELKNNLYSSDDLRLVGTQETGFYVRGFSDMYAYEELADEQGIFDLADITRKEWEGKLGLLVTIWSQQEKMSELEFCARRIQRSIALGFGKYELNHSLMYGTSHTHVDHEAGQIQSFDDFLDFHSKYFEASCLGQIHRSIQRLIGLGQDMLEFRLVHREPESNFYKVFFRDEEQAREVFGDELVYMFEEGLRLEQALELLKTPKNPLHVSCPPEIESDEVKTVQSCKQPSRFTNARPVNNDKHVELYEPEQEHRFEVPFSRTPGEWRCCFERITMRESIPAYLTPEAINEAVPTCWWLDGNENANDNFSEAWGTCCEDVETSSIE